MRTYLYIIVAIACIFAPLRSAHAISIKDVATKIEDIAEGAIELMKKAEEQLHKLEAAARDSKLGQMGAKAHQHYNNVKSFLKQDRLLANLKVPSYLAQSTTSVDKTYEKVEDNYVPVYGGGQDSQKKTKQERHNMEIQHNLVADIYAKAYVLRNYLVDERKKGDTESKPTNTRELIETGRAYNEKIVLRYVDILNLESALLDFENTDVLMNADPLRLQLAKEKDSGGE